MGGGIVTMNGSTLTVEHCCIVDNRASMGGGIAAYGTGVASLTKSIVRKNNGWSHGGGLFVRDGGTIEINCSTVTDNTSASGPVAWRFNDTGRISLANCWLPTFDSVNQPTIIGNILTIQNAMPPRSPEFAMVQQLPTRQLIPTKSVGTSIQPFINDNPASMQISLDNAFNAVRDQLHSNPSVYPQAAFDTYKAVIQTAFGVTFAQDTGAQIWGNATRGAVALHFARLGLEACANAFAQWLSGQVNPQICYTINKFSLFRRVMGPMTLRNSNVEQSFFAQVTGRTINVYRRPASNGRQAVMTPNNLIHEIGHFLDGQSGFGTKRIGSMEQAAGAASMPLDRAGMGPDYLRVQFYEHANVRDANGDGIAEFNPIAPPAGISPTQYLQFDLFGSRYALWNGSLNFTQPVNTNARLDTFVHNAAATYTETIADAFLSWVRNAFDTSAQGQNWQSFFSSSIGRFLRNAAIYNYPGGMVQFYQDAGVIPQTPIATGTRAQSRQLRLTPDASPNAQNEAGASTSLLSATVEIYGWLEVRPDPAVSDPYWLLVKDISNRLVWVASGAVQHTALTVPATPQIDPLVLDPLRSYNSSDTVLLLG